MNTAHPGRTGYSNPFTQHTPSPAATYKTSSAPGFTTAGDTPARYSFTACVTRFAPLALWITVRAVQFPRVETSPSSGEYTRLPPASVFTSAPSDPHHLR